MVGNRNTTLERLEILVRGGDRDAIDELKRQAQRHGDHLAMALATAASNSMQLDTLVDRLDGLRDPDPEIRAASVEEVLSLELPVGPVAATIQQALSDRDERLHHAVFAGLCATMHGGPTQLIRTGVSMSRRIEALRNALNPAPEPMLDGMLDETAIGGIVAALGQGALLHWSAHRKLNAALFIAARWHRLQGKRLPDVQWQSCGSDCSLNTTRLCVEVLWSVAPLLASALIRGASSLYRRPELSNCLVALYQKNTHFSEETRWRILEVLLVSPCMPSAFELWMDACDREPERAIQCLTHALTFGIEHRVQVTYVEAPSHTQQIPFTAPLYANSLLHLTFERRRNAFDELMSQLLHTVPSSLHVQLSWMFIFPKDRIQGVDLSSLPDSESRASFVASLLDHVSRIQVQSALPALVFRLDSPSVHEVLMRGALPGLDKSQYRQTVTELACTHRNRRTRSLAYALWIPRMLSRMQEEWIVRGISDASVHRTLVMNAARYKIPKALRARVRALRSL